MAEFINVQTGVEILRDLAAKEANQWHKSVYDPEWREWVDAKHRYEDAVKTYPIAMMRAQAVFLADRCLLHWVRQRIEIAASNKGPVDSYEYQRDEGKLETLYELEEELDA